MSLLHVIFKVGASEYALPGTEVFQMEMYAGATPVPGSPAYVAGLMQVRQQIVPVLDLRKRFGLSPLPPTSESRVIVLRRGERLVGILVESAREVQNFAADQFHSAPVIGKQSSGFVKSVAHFKNRIIMLLDSEKVIGEENLNG